MSDKKANAAVSRRKFIAAAGGTAALGASAAAAPRAARAAGTAHKPHYGMLIDLRRCIGCHACSVSCKAEFDVPLGATRSWVEYIEKGDYPDVSRQFLPRLCNHCSKPQCVDVCPTGATWKREEDGIVVVDADICIGCKYCILACPYDARFTNPITGTADKCDFCQHRVSQGLVPSCVNACIGEARIFGDLNDPQSEISKLIARNPVTVLRQEMGTEPNVFYIDADHTDPNGATNNGQYVRVDTHRQHAERR
ncbi:MAG: 4Fe-4S dicluster domain-containing protein [Rhodospirillales bacterium]|nr:4Fe-4S dicluster domain-containing protein [Rhodospirillales bacterium]MDH3910007.1 4Fe-4S dicluster domain-containing protein [Rhodospirillales bacterium]MDH3916713.1 4Fe-4S dicluster domain-containing protein [Rhodospirillales bacterium]MDH3965515.1 4Fe-4S dicluster domain-containing protein [Rhodospirillales bacterium]